MRVASTMTILALATAVAGVPVLAADQTILGSLLQVKNPGVDQKRTIVCKANEKGSSNTLVGDPTLFGASVTIRANGGTPGVQTFNLPRGSASTPARTSGAATR